APPRRGGARGVGRDPRRAAAVGGARPGPPPIAPCGHRLVKRSPPNSRSIDVMAILVKDLMMLRFVTFVDGSNLDGVLKHLNLRVDDYGAFYRHAFEQSVHYWGRTFAE